jgi:hypothetical protein
MIHFRIQNNRIRFERKMQRLVCSMMTFWKIINFSLIVYSNSVRASDDTGTYINSENKNIHIRQGKNFFCIILVILL